MKRYAFFVEGFTEQLFLEKLLTEIFGQNSISIEKRQIRGGTKTPISIITLTTPTNLSGTGYYILIYDCGGDSSIRSYIQDQRNSLFKTGYLKIFGIRDVFPDFDRTEINELRTGLYFRLPQSGLPTKFILSIMEIEAWFLAEENHFKNIDSTLTCDYIKNNYSFDPSTYDTEQRDNPASDLDQIYQLAGKSYRKETKIISRTINSIEYDNLYINVVNRVAALKELINEINLFFT